MEATQKTDSIDKLRNLYERLVNYTAIYLVYLAIIGTIYIIINLFVKINFLWIMLFSFFLSFFLQPVFNKINVGKPVVARYLKFLDSFFK